MAGASLQARNDSSRVRGVMAGLLPPGYRYREMSSGVVSRLIHRFFERGGWHGAGPNLEFAAFDDPTGAFRFHFQDDPTRCRRNDELLPSRNSRGAPQFPGKHNSVRCVEFDDCFHGISVAWSWRVCKNPDLRPE